MFKVIFRFFVKILLSLRYKVEIIGLDSIDIKKGFLILPNHPAEIDPVILTAFLGTKFDPRPIVLEDFFNSPALHWLFKMLRALPLPNIEEGRSEFKALRIKNTLEEIKLGLENGDNILLYPSGRLSRNGEEKIGGASALHTLLKENPDADILLARTKGLWGSSFSWIFENDRPDLRDRFLFSAKVLLINLLFFTPRRKVVIEIEKLPESFQRNGDKIIQNQFLEKWYDFYGKESLTLISYNLWTRSLPEISEKILKEVSDIKNVSEEIQKGVCEEFARMKKCKPEEISSGMDLRSDLGLDSLEIADVMSWLDDKFEVVDVSLTELTTVGAVMELAAKIPLNKGSEEVVDFQISNNKFQITKDWTNTNRPEVALSEGKIIQECFLKTCDKMGKTAACADNISGILSYKKLKIGVLLLADVIRELPGKRVGVMMPSSVGADVVTLAIMLAGKVPVMINWTLGIRNLNHVIEVSEIETILTSMKFLDNLDNVSFGGEIFKLFVFLENIKNKKLGLNKKIKAVYNSGKSAEKLLKYLKLKKVSEKDEAVVLFTSGSEAVPKGVPLTHQNILTNIKNSITEISFNKKDTVYAFLPPFHSFGLTATLFLPILSGLKVVHYPNPTEARKLTKGIKKWKITLVFGTPTFHAGILKAASPNQLDSVRLFVAGAEKAPDSLYKNIKNLPGNSQLLEGYGITECSPIVSVHRFGEPAEGVGRPLPGVDVLIVDIETQKPILQTEQGMILVSGKSVFKGYLGKNPPNPFVVINEKKWYITGDLGYLSKNGAIIIAGRLKRFVKIGGEMISLPAIEEVLKEEWPPDDDGPVVAIEAYEIEGQRPKIVLFTKENIEVDYANKLLNSAGFGNIVKISEVRKIETVPLLGTGKTDYKFLKNLM